MEVVLEFLHKLIDPNWIQQHGGLFLIALIIFAETGLFIGFFLPGDSLVFVTGMIIAGADKAHAVPFESHPLNLVFWIFFISFAAIVGNLVGYWFGKKSGPLLFKKKDSWIFKRKHLETARAFYEKRGGVAIILARFLPVVRTFAPIIAGMVGMDFKKFLTYNVIGAFTWIGGLTSIGYMLGENVWVKNNLEYIILVLVVVTTAPVVYKMFFGRKQKVEMRELEPQD